MRLDEYILPKSSKSASRWAGQLCNTSKADIAQGVWDKSSTTKYFAAALAFGLFNVFLKTPFSILGIGLVGFSIVTGLEVSPIYLPFSKASVS